MAIRENDIRATDIPTSSLDFGTWSVGKVKGVRSGISRREALKMLFLGSGVTVASAAVPFLAHRFHENATLPRGINPQEYAAYLELARTYPPPELGFYPDFENPLERAWDDADYFRTQVGQQDYIGFFALLQNAESLGFRQSYTDFIRIITYKRRKPVLSLGLGKNGLRGHPFYPENRKRISSWIDKWAKFLAKVEEEIDVRFLFEANLFHGFVAYKKDPRMVAEDHSKAFRDYFSYFYERLQHYKAHHIKLAFCPSAHGLDFAPYFPEYGVDKIGMDFYDMFENNPLAPFNLIVGTTYSMTVFERGLSQLQTLSSQHNLPMYLYELGSFSKDADFLQAVLIKFFASGGRGAFHFNPNKQRTGLPEETNWNYTSQIIQTYKTVYGDLRAA